MADRKEKAKAAEADQEILVEKEEDLDLEAEETKTEQDPFQELNNRYLRVCADYDNFRRRSKQDKAVSYEEGVIDTIRALMPVVDSIDGAIKAAGDCKSEEAREFAEGMVLIAQQLEEVFAGLGVTEIEGQGSTFDPNVHQVVIHDQDESMPENAVTEVFQKGYVKGDRVIRHSMVKVVN